MTAFQELAADDPKNVPLQLQIAEILEKKHDFGGAGAALAKAQAIQNSAEVRFAEAELMRLQGKTQQSIAAVQALLNDTKKDQYTDPEKLERMRMLNAIGAMEEDTGKTQDAVAAFRQIAELDPTLGSRVEAQIIEAYKSAKDFKLARQEADAAIKRYSGERGLVFEHALLLADLGQTDSAVNELKAVPNSAKDRDALITLAQVQDKAKRFEDERKTLDSADALSKSPQDKQNI